MKYDYVQAYNKNAAFYLARPKAKSLLFIGNALLTVGFGAAYLALWIYGIFFGEFTPKAFLRIAFIPITALLLVSVLRMMIARPRPYAEKGANITPLKKRNGKDDDSFPSRHLACAAAIAVCFFPALPIVGVILLIFCLLLGYIRFALGLHYPSDLIAGFAVGDIVAGLYFLLEYLFTFLS